jgi:hypothetical protein
MNSNEDYSAGPKEAKPGPFLARVVSNLDPTYMGILEVEILRPVGASSSESQLHQVKYMSPFYGATSVHAIGENNDFNDTQKSYGMWMVPPDVGVTVIIIFIDGDPKRGYWIGCVQDEAMNFMVPGLAATESVVEDPDPDNQGRNGRVPTAEYNKAIDDNNTPGDPDKNFKPQHPFSKVLTDQGLILDDTRGITTSSARRESPSNVFGISTPGPLDKKGKKTKSGKAEWLADTFVSRLGGSTFVMDDGDANWLRRTPPTDGPPDYASIDAGETDGDVHLPANELIRLRTRTGHQILLHNTEDLIYITNARGTSWIELTSDGKIDIYAKDSISVRTENDFNFYADRDFNIEVGRNFNLKVAERHQTEIGGDKICIVNGNVAIQVDGTKDQTVAGAVAESFESTWDVTTGDAVNITTGGDLNLNVGGASVVSSSGDFTISAANTAIDGGDINFNSGIAGDAGTATAATPPDPLPTIDNPTEIDGETITSILARIPTTEPYPHHENLDGTMFKPDATDREAETAIPVPDAWKTYSLSTDTFLKGT